MGPKGGDTKIVLDDGSGFQKSFLNMTYVKKALGESYEELMCIENQSLYEERQKLIMNQNQLKNLDVEIERQNQAQKNRHETERTRAEFMVTLAKQKKKYKN